MLQTKTTTSLSRTPAFRIGIGFLVMTLLLAVVLFNRQIGNLLELFGIKASTQEITLGGTNPAPGFGWLDTSDPANRYSDTPTSSFTQSADGSLTLNPPGN